MRRIFVVAAIVFMNNLLSNFRKYKYSKWSVAVTLQLLIFTLLVASILARVVTKLSSGEISLDPQPRDTVVTLFFDIILAILNIGIPLHHFISNSKIVYSPSEEFLLYQPLAFHELYIGVCLGNSITEIILSILFVLILIWTWPSISLFVFFNSLFVIAILNPLIKLATIGLNKRGYLRLALLIILLYTAFGLIHTAHVSLSNGVFSISPLLTYPSKAFYLLGLELFNKAGLASIALYIALCLALGLAIAFPLAKSVDINDFVSTEAVLYRAALREGLRRALRRELILDWGSPRKAVEKVLFEPGYNFRKMLVVYGLAGCLVLGFRLSGRML